MALTPPHLIGELLDAYRFVSGHDAAPRPLDPPIDTGHIICAAQQDCLQDSCARGPRTVRRDPLGELVRERGEHVTERHHRSGQLLQRHAEQTTCPRWRKWVLNVGDCAEIRRLHRAEGMPIKAIARVVVCSRNTVRSALRADGPPAYVRSGPGSVVDEVEPRIRELKPGQTGQLSADHL